MEFEELKVEIPVDDEEKDEKEFPFNLERRYENKSGCFVTGFDVTSKEALERKARRAKRFGLKQKKNDVNKTEDQSDQETDIILPSIDVKDLPAISDGNFTHPRCVGSYYVLIDRVGGPGEPRLDAILMQGVDDMSTKDVFAYFSDFAPGSVEWIDDSSCNIVWDDDFTASRVLLAVGKEIEGQNITEDEISDTVEIRWKIGPPHPKAKCLLLRLATKKDKKQPGAAQRSMYYLINGNPNAKNHTGTKKGLVSSSRKRKIQKEKERVKYMYAGGPDVLFLDKLEVEKEEKMEIDEPPLKIVVTNDGPTEAEKSESSNLRMRMYADTVEDDESDSDEDDDKREKRDKWKGRIERRQEQKEQIKPQPTLDLRSKLQSRERHGFNFKNRPSLSIEIKEEPTS